VKKFKEIINDAAVRWVLVSRLLLAVGSVVSIVLVIHRLSAVQQGIYYAFSSLISAQVLFEMGFGVVSLQRISSTFSKIDSPKPLSASRRADFALEWAGHVRLCVIWYLVCAATFFISACCGGVYYFGASLSGIKSSDWTGPWIALVSTSTLSLVITAFTIAAEGSGHVNHVSRLRSIANVGKIGALIIAIYMRAGLWSLSISILIWSLIVCLGLGSAVYAKLIDACVLGSGSKVSWYRDLFGFQWKIAVSWLSGFFIFNIMTLAILRSKTAEEAGEFGVGMALSGGLSAIANSFFVTKQFAWAGLVARKDWISLDQSWLKSTRYAIILCALAAVLLWLSALALISAWPQASRRLPEQSILILLLLVAIMNQYALSVAVYLRAHGSEVLMKSSLLFAGTMLLACRLLSYISVFDLVLIYSFATLLFGVLYSGWMLKRYKGLWHV